MARATGEAFLRIGVLDTKGLSAEPLKKIEEAKGLLVFMGPLALNIPKHWQLCPAHAALLVPPCPLTSVCRLGLPHDDALLWEGQGQGTARLGAAPNPCNPDPRNFGPTSRGSRFAPVASVVMHEGHSWFGIGASHNCTQQANTLHIMSNRALDIRARGRLVAHHSREARRSKRLLAPRLPPGFPNEKSLGESVDRLFAPEFFRSGRKVQEGITAGCCKPGLILLRSFTCGFRCLTSSTSWS